MLARAELLCILQDIYHLQFLCPQNASNPTPVIVRTKNNSARSWKPPTGQCFLWLLAAGTWWSLLSISSLRSVIFLSVLCIFTVWKNTLGEKNPLYFGRLVKYHSFFMSWIHYHCHLEDFFDLAKHRWFLLWSTLEPTYSLLKQVPYCCHYLSLSSPSALGCELSENTDCALFILYLQETK